MYNCESCLYGNKKDNGGYLCDKVLLIYGKEIHIEPENATKDCLNHSDKFIEDWRYTTVGVQDIRNADDACGVCGRLVKLSDYSQYGFVDIFDDKGAFKGEKMQCRICKEKGGK